MLLRTLYVHLVMKNLLIQLAVEKPLLSSAACSSASVHPAKRVPRAEPARPASPPSCTHPELALLTARRGPGAAEQRCAPSTAPTQLPAERQGTDRTAAQLQPNLFQRTMQMSLQLPAS